ncbi:MAG: enoyl-CoA hydratase/carnithine racemase [Gammaproteobacteria bacterium]|jgi:enoyl-CoA hydratase/carnithine racemase
MAISTKQIESVLWIVIEREAVLNALDIPHLEALVNLFNGPAAEEDIR